MFIEVFSIRFLLLTLFTLFWLWVCVYVIICYFYGTAALSILNDLRWNGMEWHGMG